MTLLSALRPLADRLWDHLCWLLFAWSLSILPDSQLTLNALNDDCLLLLLSTLSVPQLFKLRAVSRRFSYLIERYTLPQCRTLVYGFETAQGVEHFPSNLKLGDQGTVDVYFANHQHVYSDLRLRVAFPKELLDRQLPLSKLVPVRLATLPLSLPTLFPRLSCLTLTYFFASSKISLTAEQLAVNRLTVVYLASHWSSSLISLHLYLQVPIGPQHDYALFDTLNKLSSLRQLFIEFTDFYRQRYPPERMPLLPDSMSLLSQLTHFSLHFYGGSNLAILLHQLGPELTFLSLFQVIGTVHDFAAFLRAKPTYRRTIKTLEVHFNYKYEWQLPFFALTTKYLPSVERLMGYVSVPKVSMHSVNGGHSLTQLFLPQASLVPYFHSLSRFSHLRDILYVPLYICQLRALRLQRLPPGTLPRLTRIRRAEICIINGWENGKNDVSAELFSDLLPLLPDIFCSLEYLSLFFYQIDPFLCGPADALSQQLSNRVRELFPGVRHCTAEYYLEKTIGE